MAIALTFVLAGMGIVAAWMDYFLGKEKVLLIPLVVTAMNTWMGYVFVDLVVFDSGSPAFFAIFFGALLLLMFAHVASPGLPVYSVCGCSDERHDDPSCSRYEKEDA